MTKADPLERSVPALFWSAGIVCIGLHSAGFPLDEGVALQIGIALMLLGGLPHGAHDLMIARTAFGAGLTVMLGFLAAYVGVAGMMLLLWIYAPAFALVLFLGVAALHFSEDWDRPNEPFLRIAAGAAPIAAAVLGQPDAVGRLFVMLGGESGQLILNIATMIAPVALLVAAVAMLSGWQDGARQWVMAQAVALLMLFFLPPVIAFALYFALLHSRRHMVEIATAWPSSGDPVWRWSAVALTVTALTGWAFIRPDFASLTQGFDAGLAFQLLSVVAIPHIVLSTFVERHREHQRAKSILLPRFNITAN